MFVAVLVGAGIGSALLLGLALGAFVQRRSGPHLLVALAVATLVVRTSLAGLSIFGILPAADHHLLEHALDIAMVALVIGAVYYARTSPPEVA